MKLYISIIWEYFIAHTIFFLCSPGKVSLGPGKPNKCAQRAELFGTINKWATDCAIAAARDALSLCFPFFWRSPLSRRGVFICVGFRKPVFRLGLKIAGSSWTAKSKCNANASTTAAGQALKFSIGWKPSSGHFAVQFGHYFFDMMA